jgi:hypothetical protein
MEDSYAKVAGTALEVQSQWIKTSLYLLHVAAGQAVPVRVHMVNSAMCILE